MKANFKRSLPYCINIVIDTWFYLQLSRDRTQFKKDSPRKSFKYPKIFIYVLLQAHESSTSILGITDQI